MPHFQFQLSSSLKLFSSNSDTHRLTVQEAGGREDSLGVAVTLQRTQLMAPADSALKSSAFWLQC